MTKSEEFNDVGAFTLGTLFTSISLGAVSYVDAAGNRTISSCVNKKTAPCDRSPKAHARKPKLHCHGIRWVHRDYLVQQKKMVPLIQKELLAPLQLMALADWMEDHASN